MFKCVVQKLDIQQRMLTDVMLKLLGDEDQRVRHAAASAICRFENKRDNRIGY